MTYLESQAALLDYRVRIEALREEMRALQQATTPQPVNDYVFQTLAGPVTLSQLFGDKSDLLMVHNMGTSCSSCTMWADGLNGVYQHLISKAAIALSSPDEPAVQQRFAGDRGWRMPMVSHAGSAFNADMGFAGPDGGCWPGVSSFRKIDGSIVRLSDAHLGPGDGFCIVYDLLALFPENSREFTPKFQYFKTH